MVESISALAPVATRTTLRDRIEMSLAAAIVSGEMAAGRVFSAPSLAERFNVSATPVREAMLNLEKRGFVETVRNKGFRVTEVREADLREIVAIRLMLEGPAMREVAEVFPASAGRLPELRSLARRIAESAAGGDMTAYLAADAAFHLELLAMLGNGRLVELVAQLRSQTRLVGLASMLDSEEMRESVAEHQALLDLLSAGDGPAAEQLMRRHVSHVLGWWAGRSEAD